MKTNDHVTDHATDHGCDVSLIEQLKSVPLNSREWIKNEKGSGLRNIPYGRYCQEAAEALQKAKAEVERLREQLDRAIQIAEETWELEGYADKDLKAELEPINGSPVI